MGLSDAMMDAWIRFIRTGDPNHTGMTLWPAYETERRATRIFNEKPALRDDPDQAARLLYQGILYGKPDEKTAPR